MDSMITSSLNINKYNKQETQSPIEKIIKMWDIKRTFK
jgi:hypothetical protein